MKRNKREASIGNEETSAKRSEAMQAQIDELRASLASLEGNMVVVADILVAGVAANRLILAQLVARNLAVKPAGVSADARSELGRFHQTCLDVVNVAFTASSSMEVRKLCEMTVGKIDDFFVEVVAAAQLIDAATDADSMALKH